MMTDTKTLIPTEQLLEIARQIAKKHRSETHPDFEDFEQDILLGVLERQHEYDPACGTVKTFVLTVANQKACNRSVEQRRREKLIATNRNGCIPFRNAPENANELDAKGDLSCIDESVLFARFCSTLKPLDAAVLKSQLAGYSAGETVKRLGISMSAFREAKKNLAEKIVNFRFFQKNNAPRGNE